MPCATAIATTKPPALGEALNIDRSDVDRLKHSPSRIPVGATLDREDLLRLALMSSENRAAAALSRNIPGGQATFIRSMNAKARELGMAHSHFEDPTGLSPHNVSTARDVVRLADAASRYPLIREFTTLSNYMEKVGARTLHYRNSDPLVGRPGWDIAISKTGFTNEAGRCIAVEADLANGPVIVALMGAPTSAARSTDLMSIRNWLEGNATPVIGPRAHYVNTSMHRHKGMAVPRGNQLRLIAYSVKSASNAHGPTNKHTTAKLHRNHRSSAQRVI
ncbi:D-alanyl-D-alanine carboxypeptidase family protein [Caballeronia terrestris]|uniref:D-alanyl-D-alanine carboxypeptidase family protein n=1 Tax=Caballeronia terrestris TaxID=1226301 RepID=A0A158KMZ8_9BURK|nr:serine hydrolase [Caballeronia terrestris]SAL82464.1 D-alanyl-D-alanine carboxypeptidase family protein [Caballeronia terrestris]